MRLPVVSQPMPAVSGSCSVVTTTIALGTRGDQKCYIILLCRAALGGGGGGLAQGPGGGGIKWAT